MIYTRSKQRLKKLPLLALAIACTLLLINWAGPAPAQDVLPNPSSSFVPPAADTLRVGTHLRSLDTKDLENNSFDAHLMMWTLWSGDPADNPSDNLTILNDVYTDDSTLFEKQDSKQYQGSTWTLYSVRSRFIHRWRLDDYPFDAHVLSMRIGFSNPLRQDITLEADQTNSGVSPELYFYGWNIGNLGISHSEQQVLSSLGIPALATDEGAKIQAITTTLELKRNPLIYFIPNFSLNIVAVCLCVLALLIRTSRDDLILAAVVLAAGNYTYLTSILPEAALAGFVGQLQAIVLAGIVYVICSDTIIEQKLLGMAPKMAQFLRSAVLPSYLLVTILAIYTIIPGGVVNVG